MTNKILLIDDDIDELYIFKEALQEINAVSQCFYAENVGDGLKMLKDFIPDFIFIDINMPGINGLEGIRLISEMTIDSKVPLFAYSTAVNDELNLQAIAMGALASVKKPESISHLAHILHSIIKKDGPQNAAINTGSQHYIN
ncbi:MAG: response regulator [Chitinophagaceae bacterium]